MVILNVSVIKATRGSEERVACFVNCSEDASLIVCSMLKQEAAPYHVQG